MDKKVENLLQLSKTTELAVFAGLVELPGRVESGDEWKKNLPENLIHLPIIIGMQCFYADFDERTEAVVENCFLDTMQEVNAISGKTFTVGTKDKSAYLLEYTISAKDKHFQEFYDLWREQQIICVEYRLRLGKLKQIPAKDEKPVLPPLLFSIGGVWDDKSRSWIFEPASYQQEIWN